MQKTGISIGIQNFLYKIQENKDLLTGKYLNNTENENFIGMLKHLYPDNSDRMKLLNPGSYIGNIIGDKIKNFIGEPKVAFDNINYDVVIQSLLTRGEILLKYTNTSDNTLGLVDIDPATYYFDGETEYIVKMYEKEDENNILSISDTYMYVQTYNKGALKNNLYKMRGSNQILLSEGIKVPLDTIPQTKGLLPKQVINNLDRLVISIIVGTIDDMPLIETLKTIIYSLDRKIAEAEKNYNDFTEQFKVFQNIDFPKNAMKQVNGGKVIDWDLLGKTVKTKDFGGIGDIKIIKNTNELLDKAIEFIDKQIVYISSITDIPLEFFGIKGAGDSGNGKVVGYSAFYKRINKYRTKIEKGLKIGLDYLGILDKSVIWEPIIRMSDEEILANETIKLQNKLTSVRRAIMKTNNVDEAEAEVILEEIKQDIKDGLSAEIGTTEKIEDTINKTKAKLQPDNN